MKRENYQDEHYVSPSTMVEKMFLEGVLCASSKEGSTEEWVIVDLSNL